jgi:hypothetical protein
MIKFAKLKFMHCYVNLNLPLSFHELWPFNRDVNPDRVLRNANNLRVPPHHFATIKRMPLFNFPHAWKILLSTTLVIPERGFWTEGEKD